MAVLDSAHSLHVDGLRRKSRRPPHVGLDNVGVEHSAPAADGASGRDLDRALQLLSGEQRRVVLLVGLEGLSYAETAEVLAIPVGTVMSRLARARPIACAVGLRRRQERPRLAAEGEMTPPRHISEAELHALVDGELTGEERAEIEALMASAPNRAEPGARFPRPQSGHAGSLLRPARGSPCLSRC